MPTTPRARSWFLLVTAGAGLVTGCGSEEPVRNARAVRVEVGAPVDDECPEESVPRGMERLAVRAEDGTPIGAATLGSGDTAVVLVHGAGQDLCDWLPFARQLEQLDVMVVPYDLRGRGASGGSRADREQLPDDLASVVAEVRDRGVERVVLVGTSLGAATALVAAGRVDPPVDAVVAVSPPVDLSGVDVESEARRYGGPIYLLAASGDEIFAGNVHELASALPSVEAATILDGSEHGMRLVQAHPDEVVRTVRRAVEQANGA